MASALLIVGTILYLVGALWLVYQAWSNDSPLMAVAIFFIAPIFGTIYFIQHFDEAKIPFGVMLVGFVLRIAGAVMAS